MPLYLQITITEKLVYDQCTAQCRNYFYDQCTAQ